MFTQNVVMNVRQFSLPNTGNNEKSDLVTLLDEAKRWQNKQESGSRCLVHCLYVIINLHAK